jgi:hypothetical protein
MAKAVGRSLDIYLKAVKGSSAMGDIDSDNFLKIGELAKAAGENVSTIRYWTKEGLLSVAEVTAVGYQLYSTEMIQVCKRIRQFQEQRYSITEIKLL